MKKEQVLRLEYCPFHKKLSLFYKNKCSQPDPDSLFSSDDVPFKKVRLVRAEKSIFIEKTVCKRAVRSRSNKIV